MNYQVEGQLTGHHPKPDANEHYIKRIKMSNFFETHYPIEKDRLLQAI